MPPSVPHGKQRPPSPTPLPHGHPPNPRRPVSASPSRSSAAQPGRIETGGLLGDFLADPSRCTSQIQLAQVASAAAAIATAAAAAAAAAAPRQPTRQGSAVTANPFQQSRILHEQHMAALSSGLVHHPHRSESLANQWAISRPQSARPDGRPLPQAYGR